MAKQFFTGMRGVFLVAAELCQLGFIVSPTSRGAAGADLLVTDKSCKRAFSVQVKTDATKNKFWLLNKQAKELVSPTHIYILVKLGEKGEKEFFIIPSKVIAEKMMIDKNKKSTFPYFDYLDAEPYRGRWDLFGGL